MSYDWKLLEKSAQDPVYISSDLDLVDCCDYWQTLPLVAVDTEFQRIDTFYPIPGLIQVADDKDCYLIDPVSISDFSPLTELFENESVLKVVHAGSEDLELFQHVLGCLPRPIFDTQIAAAFAGWGFTMGLQRIVESTLGITLGKGETTSNWLKRPLSENQKIYAALDVAYLPAICELLTQELHDAGRLSWFREESDYSLEQAIDMDPDGSQYYRRFSQMWSLPDYKMAALRDITQWREQQSRVRDVPRNRVLRNQTILSIVNQWPGNNYELSRAEDMKSRAVKNDGETILAFLKNSKLSAQEAEVQPIQKPLPIIWNKRVKKLKALSRKIATDIGICPEVLLRKKDLDALIRSKNKQGRYTLPAELSGWRKDVVGIQLLEMLERFETSGE